MNTDKWDAFAEDFAAGQVVPANGWEAWCQRAMDEAATIRKALPTEADVLVEVGCGVGRLTPYLALLFPIVIALDTSAACRMVTRERCSNNGNVTVMPADAKLPEPAGRTYAALVWGRLYDNDWPTGSITGHRERLRAEYPIVLEGDSQSWALTQTYPDGSRRTTLDKGALELP